MNRIAVLTSGGDAPGMNSAIRAVVRTGIARKLEVLGVRDGFEGLVEDRLDPLGARSVGSIMQIGGTVLGSARCEAFVTEAGRARALEVLRAGGIDGLVVIGGSGSQQGSLALDRLGLPVVGIASTIDNDLCGSDITLGVDTALNVALDAIDKLRVTASSHRRATAVETMGRDFGYLALMAGLAGGAECIILPEIEVSPDEVVETVRSAFERGKSHALIVVAEGARYDLDRLTRYFHDRRAELDCTLRATRLGHVQRGGTPTAFDRILGARFGAAAVEALVTGEHGVLVGWVDGRVHKTPLAEVAGKTKTLDRETIDLAGVLDR